MDLPMTRKKEPECLGLWPPLSACIYEALYGFQAGTPIKKGYDEKGRKLMTISQAKASSILNGLTSIAENVYEHVTDQNLITTAGVISSLHAAGKNTDRKKIEGCLQNLKRKGLINEPSPGTWIRVQIHAKNGDILVAERGYEEKKPVKKRTRPVAVPTSKPVETSETKSPSEKLMQLKGELQAALEILMDIEDRMSGVIQECEEAVNQAAKDNEQFRQLKKLLKGIAD